MKMKQRKVVPYSNICLSVLKGDIAKAPVFTSALKKGVKCNIIIVYAILCSLSSKCANEKSTCARVL